MLLRNIKWNKKRKTNIRLKIPSIETNNLICLNIKLHIKIKALNL